MYAFQIKGFININLHEWLQGVKYLWYLALSNLRWKQVEQERMGRHLKGHVIYLCKESIKDCSTYALWKVFAFLISQLHLICF